MFTGIIQTKGRLTRFERRSDGARLTVACPDLPASELSEGDSVAVSGVCLTALDIVADGFSADLSAETLARTTLGQRRTGEAVNLEPALRASDRLGGHLVSGHVDGLGEVRSLEESSDAWNLRLAAPKALMRYIAPKGSITVDGVSLTVNEVGGDEFTMAIIPHTRERTTLGELVPGAGVNLEVDLIARYLARLIETANDS